LVTLSNTRRLRDVQAIEKLDTMFIAFIGFALIAGGLLR
jgi:hypothetical protein